MKELDQNESVASEKLLISTEKSKTSNIHLTWKNLDLKINIKNTDKNVASKTKTLHVLKNLSGFARSGECLAIMGGSGAGKSTLLNIISGRFEVESNMTLLGDVRLNSQKMNWETYKNVIGFVMQKDIFMETLTVKEIFEFVVSLRNYKLTESQKTQKIEETIKILKLKRAENNIVGSATQKGISGGEKRRLNIGFELLSDPSVLFLDEPTSGLDSYTSFIIVKLLRELARQKNMLIIYTIHQPSTDIFKMFDKLMILNKGKVAYFGYAEDSLAYYQNLGFNIKLDKNPVDQYLDIAIKGDPETDQKFFDHFQKAEEPAVLQFINLSNERPLNPKRAQAPFTSQFSVLFKRTLMNFFRTPLTLKLKIVQVLVISFFFILLYWDLPDIDVLNNASIQNRLGALFFVSLNLFVLYFQTAMATFPVEKDIFCKEYDSGLYGLMPYYISKLSIEIPLTAIFPSIFVFLVYFTVGFENSSSAFFNFWVISVLECLVGLMLGIFFGTIVPSLQLAIEISPIIFIPFILFSGFTTNTENILLPMKPFEYVSPMRYTFEFLVRNEFYSHEELEQSHPIETLNFNFTQSFILIFMLSYVSFLIVITAFSLRFCSRGVKN